MLRKMLALAAVLAAAPTLAGGEIYGTIHTARGEAYTGPIRWDTNENFWDDTLDAVKTERVQTGTERYRIRIFGLRLGDDSWVRHAFSIPFGHLKSLEPGDGKDVVLTLKNGQEIVVQPSSSDLGSGMRGLIVEDPQAGKQDIAWSLLDRVEFRQSPDDGRDAERLWGTVETEDGPITGFLVWDRDEAMLEDVIDGEDEDGRDREIPLRGIRAIERQGRRGSLVTLTDGTRLMLSGTNDIDDGHRGVSVQVTGMGRADVPWDEVKVVTFGTAPASPVYADFDGGHRLRATVRTRSGATHAGELTWDRDERYDWETLDGERGAIDWSVPFNLIASITVVHDRAEVHLRNNRLLLLEGSNDVSRENKGILVTGADGVEVDLAFTDIVTVTFE